MRQFRRGNSASPVSTSGRASHTIVDKVYRQDMDWSEVSGVFASGVASAAERDGFAVEAIRRPGSGGVRLAVVV